MKNLRLTIFLSIMTFSFTWQSCENGEKIANSTPVISEKKPKLKTSNKTKNLGNPSPSDKSKEPIPAASKKMETSIYGTYLLDKEQTNCDDGVEFQRITITKDDTYPKGFELALVMDEEDLKKGYLRMKGKMTGAKTFEVPKQMKPCQEFDCDFVKADGKIEANGNVTFNLLISDDDGNLECSFVFIKKEKKGIVSDAIMSEVLSSIADNIETEKLEYNSDLLQDASGIYHKIKNEFQKRMPTLSEGKSFQYPLSINVRTTRQIADWYFKNDNLLLVQDALTSRNNIRPGSVMFYGKSEESFQNINIDQLTDRKNNYTTNGIIQHIAVVTSVKKDQNGNVEEYTIMHGRRPGKIAFRSTSKEIQSTNTKGLPPYGNWKQQWVAIAPTIYTPTNNFE